MMELFCLVRNHEKIKMNSLEVLMNKVLTNDFMKFVYD